jgi:hypothetical protein
LNHLVVPPVDEREVNAEPVLRAMARPDEKQINRNPDEKQINRKKK